MDDNGYMIFDPLETFVIEMFPSVTVVISLQVYSNCTCAQASLESPSHGDSNITADLFNLTLTAKPGKCDSDCILLYVFIPVTFIALLCTFMMSVPGTTIILR